MPNKNKHKLNSKLAEVRRLPRLANPVWCPCEEYTLDPGVYLRTIFHRCLRRRVESRVTNQEKSSVKSPVIVQSVLVRCKNHSETALSQSSFLKIKISEFPPLPLQSQRREEKGGGERFCRNTPLSPASCLLSLSVVGPASGTGASGLYSEANRGRV